MESSKQKGHSKQMQILQENVFIREGDTMNLGWKNHILEFFTDERNGE